MDACVSLGAPPGWVQGKHEGVDSGGGRVPHLLVTWGGGESRKVCTERHLHPKSQAPDFQVPSAWGPQDAVSRPSTYSQNSMTGEVTFPGEVAVLAAERFRKSTQRSVGSKAGASAADQVGGVPHTLCPSLWAHHSSPRSFLRAPTCQHIGSWWLQGLKGPTPATHTPCASLGSCSGESGSSSGHPANHPSPIPTSEPVWTALSGDGGTKESLRLLRLPQRGPHAGVPTLSPQWAPPFPWSWFLP